MCFPYWQNHLPRGAVRPPWNPPYTAAPMARPTLPLTALRRHQVTLSLRDAELIELRRRGVSGAAAGAGLPPAARVERAAAGGLAAAAGGRRVPRGVAARGEREPDRPLPPSGPPAPETHDGSRSSGCGPCSCSCCRRRRTDVICKLHRSGGSFRGAIAYCLGEARDRELGPRGRATGTVPTPGARSRVAWTETVNLATDDARVAARQMAATVSYAPELKALAGVRAGGRRLEKPVDALLVVVGAWMRQPPHATMVNAARVKPAGARPRGPPSRARRAPRRHDAACARGGEPGVDRGWPRRALEPVAARTLAVGRIVRAEAGPHPVSPARGAQPGSPPRRAAVRPVPAPPRCTTGRATGDAHYRRTQCGRIARVPIVDGRSALEMAGVAVRRVDEQRKWQTASARFDDARAPLDEQQRREWASLYARQEDERDRLDVGLLDRCAAGSSGGARMGIPGATSAA